MDKLHERLHAIPDPDTYEQFKQGFGIASTTDIVSTEHFIDEHKHHHHQPTHEHIAVAAYYIWLREAAEPIVDLDSPELAVSNWLEAEQDLIADHLIGKQDEHDKEIMEIVNKHTEENG